MTELTQCDTVADTSQFTYLAGLNERQREAVLASEGPVLVLAGAGTGKTRVLTTRLVHILATGRAWPNQILAVTFTNSAALEMKTRIAAMLGRPVEGWWLGTFHALAARILRRHAELVGLKPNFTILDMDDQLRLVKQLMQAEGIDTQKWPSRVIHGVIERWKDRGLTPDKVSRAEQAELASGRILDIYRDYQQRLMTLNACDFGDLLLHNIAVFQSSPDVLSRYQQQFRYMLVDEYQDTNVAQYLWLRLLAQGHKNLCVRRRRRPVDLWLARRRGREHPEVRAGFPGRQGHPPGAELPFDAAYPGGRLRADRP